MSTCISGLSNQLTSEILRLLVQLGHFQQSSFDFIVTDVEKSSEQRKEQAWKTHSLFNF